MRLEFTLRLELNEIAVLIMSVFLKYGSWNVNYMPNFIARDKILHYFLQSSVANLSYDITRHRFFLYNKRQKHA